MSAPGIPGARLAGAARRARAVTTRARRREPRPVRRASTSATHVGDDAAAVAENRARLRHALALPGEPRGSSRCMARTSRCCRAGVRARPTRAVTSRAGASLRRAGRGLPAGLSREPRGRSRRHRACGLARARRAASSRRRSPRSIASRARSSPGLAPPIGPQAFEVGHEVRDAFVARRPGRGRARFAPGRDGRFLADLPALARRRLAAARRHRRARRRSTARTRIRHGSIPIAATARPAAWPRSPGSRDVGCRPCRRSPRSCCSLRLAARSRR